GGEAPGAEQPPGARGPLGANARYVTGRLVKDAPARMLHVLDTYREGSGAAWASKPPAAAVPVFETDERAEAALHARWTEAADEVSKPRFRPRGVSSLAHDLPPAAEDETASPAAACPGDRRGRFGPVFGDTVHLAVGHALRGLPAEEAVRRAARVSGLAERFSEAVGDVSRALAALKAAGLLSGPGVELMIEYPVSGPGPDGALLSGYVDLLAADSSGFVVVDFKTDPPPDGAPEQAYPAYAAQLRGYVDLLAPIVDAARKPVRAFLLFTASGRMMEVAGCGRAP
ncbi:MAG: PD-(D/E)XK nuclease family protein, partial [Myxococcota bacterium]|nr:PD-(D/E)XK nuclease family protein [Myxococcota bacterium]